MKLIAQIPFDWAHKGIRVERFEEGAEIETEDQELIDVSTREGWARLERAPAGPAAPACSDVPGRKPQIEPETASTSTAKPGRKGKAKE